MNESHYLKWQKGNYFVWGRSNNLGFPKVAQSIVSELIINQHKLLELYEKHSNMYFHI